METSSARRSRPWATALLGFGMTILSLRDLILTIQYGGFMNYYRGGHPYYVSGRHAVADCIFGLGLGVLLCVMPFTRFRDYLRWLVLAVFAFVVLDYISGIVSGHRLL